MIFAPESIHTKVSPNENSELDAVSTLVSEKSCTYSGIEKNPVRYIYIYIYIYIHTHTHNTHTCTHAHTQT